MSLIFFLGIIVFLIGLYFYIKAGDPQYFEGLTNNTSSSPRCPDLLIQKGSRFYLYNSKVAKVPGVNPIEFENLEDYTEFLDWQRSQNIRCPVLYLQETYDAQGNKVYKSRPNIHELQAGLPPSTAVPIGFASQVDPLMETALEPIGDAAYPNTTLLVDAGRNNPPYNKNSYPAYDETEYYVGKTTPLDTLDIHHKALKISPNPMEQNWGGAEYTQKLVEDGYYNNNK